MLRVLSIFASAALISSAASAQFYFCSRPSEPYIPFGSYAESWDMELAETEVQFYLDQMNEYHNCLSREAQDAEYEADRVIDEWNSAVAVYNSRF